MKSIQLFTILSLCFSSQAFSQETLFWSQYAAGNPAATGINSDLDVSSITSYYGNKLAMERFNADARIKKLHGAVGVGYRYLSNQRFGTYQMNNPYLNYSFHIKTGENSMLAFGAGVNWIDNRSTYPGVSTTLHSQETSYSLGTHFQYKRLKVGMALSTFEGDYNKTGVEISDIYADYTFKFGDNWQLHTAAHLGNFRTSNYGNTILARAIYKNKYWIGTSYTDDREVGFMAGINLNDHWSIGYSMGVRFSNGLGGNQIANQNLLVRFQMPWK